MEKEKKSFLEKTAEIFDLPPDMLAGLPRLELIGRTQFRMEHHRGILSYDTEEIHISGGKLLVVVKGEGLELRAMNADELLVTGFIHSLEVE